MAEWQRVLTEARALGVLQLHLSGGEPLQRRDLVELVASARELGLYTNLITSALGLSPRRAEQLKTAGLDHVQISIQADEPALSDRIAGTPSYGRKIAAVRLVKELGWPLTLNVVLHRHNIDRIGRILDLAEELGADRIELANTQYYGWAWHNRAALLPSRAQLDQAEAVVRAARQRLERKMQIIYVLPDYYSEFPKPCQGGWGNFYLVVAPDGRTMPCHAASQITTLTFDNVREHSVRHGSGRSRPSSNASGERSGCRSLAGVVSAARSISAVAAARRFSSPAMPRAPIRSATSHPTIGLWPRR